MDGDASEEEKMEVGGGRLVEIVPVFSPHKHGAMCTGPYVTAHEETGRSSVRRFNSIQGKLAFQIFIENQ